MLAQEGSQRPRRLIEFASLIAYLNSLPLGSDPTTIVPRGKHLPKQKTNRTSARPFKRKAADSTPT
jgi:hypothetical protein